MEHDASTNHPRTTRLSGPIPTKSPTSAPNRSTRTSRTPTKKKGKLVTITVDTNPHTIRKGRYVVADFKRLAGVDPSYQLDEVVNGQFVELKDTEKVSIKGKEIFVSHVRGGAAS